MNVYVAFFFYVHLHSHQYCASYWFVSVKIRYTSRTKMLLRFFAVEFFGLASIFNSIEDFCLFCNQYFYLIGLSMFNNRVLW